MCVYIYMYTYVYIYIYISLSLSLYIYRYMCREIERERERERERESLPAFCVSCQCFLVLPYSDTDWGSCVQLWAFRTSSARCPPCRGQSMLILSRLLLTRKPMYVAWRIRVADHRARDRLLPGHAGVRGRVGSHGKSVGG